MANSTQADLRAEFPTRLLWHRLVPVVFARASIISAPTRLSQAACTWSLMPSLVPRPSSLVPRPLHIAGNPSDTCPALPGLSRITGA